MITFLIAVISAGCMFSGFLLGMKLQDFLPKHHLNKESNDTIKLGIGIIATLTALVLGLLVSSAKGTVQASAKILDLNQVLTDYGPDAQPVRDELRQSLATSIERLWPTHDTGVTVLAAVQRGTGMEAVRQKLRLLTPQTDDQRELLARARQIVDDITQTRWLLIQQAQNDLPISPAFLVVLIFWLTLIFTNFGLFAPRHGTVIVVMFCCSLSMAAAIFMILELSHPLSGSIKLSSSSMRNALAQISR
jgi:hypothetical protein